MKPTFVDLFAGAGLFSHSFQKAGFLPALAVELDANAVLSYRRNVNNLIVQGSVTDLVPPCEVDVVIAGPPCQGFSTLGRRDPKDSRNALCFDILRWSRMSKAKIVVIENVPPFLNSPQWKKLAKKFQQAEMEVETWELNAVEYGVPQRRRRSFTIASKIGRIGAPKGAEIRLKAGPAFRGLRSKDPMHRWPIHQGVAKERIALVPLRGDKRDVMRIAPHLCPPSWARVGANATDVYGRIDPSEPANTIRCTFQNPSKGRYLHPTEDRVISLREGARLQGIPDDWLMEGGHYPVARQIGNGVPIPLGIAVAERIREALR